MISFAPFATTANPAPGHTATELATIAAINRNLEPALPFYVEEMLGELDSRQLKRLISEAKDRLEEVTEEEERERQSEARHWEEREAAFLASRF